MQPRRKVVVCGGHPTFLKTFKKLVGNDVRYIAKNNFNSTTLKGATEIWIQSNAIDHGFQSRILNYARANGIPFYYFGYASAQKCADQMKGKIK